MLVTRPAHQSDAFAQLLQEHGAIAVLAPVIAFQPPDNPQHAEYAVHHANEYAWIVFTSANGVAAFFEALDSRREDARALGQAKIGVIGTGTASALRLRGIYADLMPGAFVAEDLAQSLITATQPGDRILIFRAQEARDILPQMLRDAARNVDVVAAYKTVTVRFPNLRAKAAACDIFTFSSASTVRAFRENVGDVREASLGKTVACIGPITAQAARGAGMHVDVVARTFTAQGLLDALLQHLA